jgi:3-phosphoshikimate 1-carboxyvinyltransferase
MTAPGSSERIRIAGPASVQGEIEAPGDKSISHRAVILGALAEGETAVSNLSPGDDARRTVDALRAMGVRIEAGGDRIEVEGTGGRGLEPPREPLDCGNSGTSMRLLAGVLAGQPFTAVLGGDASLSRRPMRRIVEPLGKMGARISGREAGSGPAGTAEILPPLTVGGPGGGGSLQAIDHVSRVASAQVKSAVLLAGLFASGTTSFEEPDLSRDHTERMLGAFGARIRREGLRVTITGGARLRGMPVEIPGDPSAAAFFLVAALVTPGSEVRVRRVGMNQTRTGLLDILRAMGARIEISNAGDASGEPVADLVARTSDLSAVSITETGLIVRAIDEFPILAVAAARAAGTTRIRNAGELRAKESDRLAAMAAELGKLGVRTKVWPDGVDIEGGATLKGAHCSSHGDHRVAMSLAVAGLAAEGETVIEDTSIVATSFPGFTEALASIRKSR